MSNFKDYDYVDTDSAKQALNARYGKETGMKDYIVVHPCKNETAIIFKKSIDAIIEREGGVCIVIKGRSLCCEDTYKDVVMKVLK